MGRGIRQQVLIAGISVLAITVLACSHVGETYKHSLRRWHRHAEVFDFNSLRAELMWDAMLVTPELRAFRVEREAQLRHIAVENTRQYIPSAWNASGTVFFISFFAPRDVKDLLAEDGYWHLELQDGSGRAHAPLEILQMPITPMTRKLFPFINSWAKTYIVRFSPRLPGPLTLTLYGLNATSKLAWQEGTNE